MPGFELFFQLLVGHAAADFVFQPDPMARGKNRHSEIHRQKSAGFPKWYYWLGAHALLHGGMVYIITGSFVLGLIETLSHWSIDSAKSEGFINFHQDQALHISFKIGYLIFLL